MVQRVARRGFPWTIAALSIIAGCALPELTKSEGSGAATATSNSGPSAGGNGASTGDGGSQAAGGSAPCPGDGSGDPATVALSVPIAQDSDDATWIKDKELLNYDVNDGESVIPMLEVGADGDIGKTGLRFALSVPRGSTIKGATLTLHRHGGEADDDETIKVQVYDTTSVPPFNEMHAHDPENHVDEGLWPTSVVSDAGRRYMNNTTSDLKELLQHVIDKPEWCGTGDVGFVISPQTMTDLHWVEYFDSSEKSDPPTLYFEYTPP